MTVMAASNTGHSDTSNSDDDIYSLFHIQGNDTIKVEVVVEQSPITMEIDTGAAVSVISGEEYDRWLKKHVQLKRTPLELHMHVYGGDRKATRGVYSQSRVCWAEQAPTPVHLSGKGTHTLGPGMASGDQVAMAVVTHGHPTKSTGDPRTSLSRVHPRPGKTEAHQGTNFAGRGKQTSILEGPTSSFGQRTSS